MQDSKDSDWQADYDVAGDAATAVPEEETGGAAQDAATQDGWQQYRRWISKAPAPRARRTGLDPSLYTWKGYRNWTEQVKRNWSDN